MGSPIVAPAGGLVIDVADNEPGYGKRLRAMSKPGSWFRTDYGATPEMAA